MLLVEFEEFLPIYHPIILLVSLPHKLQCLLTNCSLPSPSLPLVSLQHHPLDLLQVQEVIVIEVKTVEEPVKNFSEILFLDHIELAGPWGGGVPLDVVGSVFVWMSLAESHVIDSNIITLLGIR